MNEQIYAVIENGVCINTIISGPEFAAEIGAVLLPEGYGKGDRFDGSRWSKTEPEEQA